MNKINAYLNIKIITGVIMYFQLNNVKLAVDRVGGPTKVSNLLHVSNGTIHSWIKNGRVPNIDHAKKLAVEAKMAVEEMRPV